MLGEWYQGWGNGHVNKWGAKAVEQCVPFCRSPSTQPVEPPARSSQIWIPSVRRKASDSQRSGLARLGVGIALDPTITSPPLTLISPISSCSCC